ncbi:helix-turn-helix domain-containing protein [Fodinisporobacter ferrooxydans]
MEYKLSRWLLLQLLNKKGMTQQELAERLDMPKSQIDAYCHDNKK